MHFELSSGAKHQNRDRRVQRQREANPEPQQRRFVVHDRRRDREDRHPQRVIAVRGRHAVKGGSTVGGEVPRNLEVIERVVWHHRQQDIEIGGEHAIAGDQEGDGGGGYNDRWE